MRLAIIMSAALAALAASIAAAADDESAVLQAIIDAAQRREATAARFDWRCSGEVFFAGEKEPVVVGSVHFLRFNEKAMFELENRIRFSGREGGEHDEHDERTAVIKCVGDGAMLRELTHEMEPEEHLYGSVSEGDSAEVFRHAGGLCHYGIDRLMHDWPPLSVFVQLTSESFDRYPEWRDTFKDYAVERSVRFDEYDGRRVAVVEFNATGSEGNRHLWRLFFDPDLDYSCVRSEKREFSQSGEEKFEVFIMDDFRTTPDGLFLPYSMRLESTSEGVANFRTESVEFPSSVDDSLFTLEFPPGTRVWDRVAGLRYDKSEVTSEIMPEIAEELEAESPDVVDVGEESLEAAPAEEGGPVAAEPAVEENKQSGPLLVSILLTVVLLALVVAFALTRRRRKTQKGRDV